MSTLGNHFGSKTIWVFSFSLLLFRRIATLFQVHFSWILSWIFRTRWSSNLSRLVKRLVLRKTSFLYLGHSTTCKFLRVLHCCSLLFVVNDYFSCVSSLVLTSLYVFWFLFVQLLSFVCMLFLIYFWDCYEHSTSSIYWLLSIG